MVLERFDGYWGEKPDVEKATYVWRTESSVRAGMVATGEADIAPNITELDATDPSMDFSYFNSETRRCASTSRARRWTTSGCARRSTWRSTAGPDRHHLPQGRGAGDPAGRASINGHNPDLKVWPYDPDQAMALLEEARAAGVPVDNEITLLGRIEIYPNATESMEALLAMLQAVGLNVKLRMVEVAEWVDIYTKPFAEDRPPTLHQTMHDNNNGDAVFTVFFKYHSDGAQSVLSDKELDGLIQSATVDRRSAPSSGRRPSADLRGPGGGRHALSHGRLYPGRPAREVHAVDLDQQRAAARSDQVRRVGFPARRLEKLSLMPVNRRVNLSHARETCFPIGPQRPLWPLASSLPVGAARAEQDQATPQEVIRATGRPEPR